MGSRLVHPHGRSTIGDSLKLPCSLHDVHGHWSLNRFGPWKVLRPLLIHHLRQPNNGPFLAVGMHTAVALSLRLVRYNTLWFMCILEYVPPTLRWNFHVYQRHFSVLHDPLFIPVSGIRASSYLVVGTAFVIRLRQHEELR